MKTNAAIEKALKEDNAVRAVPRISADWNMNRIYSVQAENTPLETEEGFEVEMFPISSIVEPRRPLKGINKARIGSATIGDAYLSSTSEAMQPRFYVADVDDVYKYWTSPVTSDSNGALTKTKPYIVYASSVLTNKIVITTENSWATAKTFSIQVTTSATPTDASWTEIANQTTVGNAWKASGQIVLYYSGSAWNSTVRVDGTGIFPPCATIRGIRMVVTALEGGYAKTDSTLVPTFYKNVENGVTTTTTTNGKNSFFDLISMAAHLEVDLSSNLMTVEDTSEMSDSSFFYPIGTVTVNQATAEFSNLYEDANGITQTGLFSPENADSPFKDYLDSTARFVLKYDYYNEVGTSLGTINQFVMYSSTWSGLEGESASVQLDDEAKFFNEVMVPSALWENLTVPEIIWRVLDSVGFSNYRIDQNADKVTTHTIPIYYTTGEQTIWEVLDELAKASQTAIYFDSNGILRVRTRDFAFSPSNAAVANLSSVSSGTSLPNIMSLEQETVFDPNYYSVTYQTTNWSEFNQGQPTMQKVWEPEGTVTLRAAPLLRNMSTTSGYFHVSSAQAKVWPYEGIVNIQGELITYRGKEFVYHTGTTGLTRNVKVIASADEYKQFNELTPADYRYKNYFTGGMYIIERGLWNSEIHSHYVEASGWNVRNRVNGTSLGNAPGFTHLKDQSRVQLESGTRFKDEGDILVATKGSSFDSAFTHYGTRMRLVSATGQTTQCAGIVIHNNDTTEDGYFIEITPSRRLGATERKSRNELIVFSRVGGKYYRIGGVGRALAIGENIDYDIDVTCRVFSTYHQLQVWVNGKLAMSTSITGAQRNPAGGRFGMFLRGKTKTTYEYLYGIARAEPDPPDDFSFLDKVERGYTGNAWDREWVYKMRTITRRVKKKTIKEQRKWNNTFFDEFGPIVHELRQFEVKFDPAPVLHSRVYSTNDWGGVVLEYRADPFGAIFLIANTNRKNTVLNGSDTLSFAGTNSAVDQVLTVLGRALVVAEAETIIAQNPDQVRRRGKIESELSSPWIQSKAMAQDVADWMNKNFSYGNDTITVEVFGNPLIEVGDVVNVNYPDKHISGDYFVLSTNNQFDQGLNTSMTLRKRIAQA